ncbi:unnamed protein product [Thlaspi arvense]|uniref:Uncharacterized protein n=1 Tax=Thlaspi arvense TaxID=13288 RepID=A0AAU9R7G9_THLAR|nr:unnamed protein product [Thlaspi arvense]
MFTSPNDGHGLANGPLPRLVIAELLVDELSFESQEIVRRYLIPEGGKQAVLSSTLGFFNMGEAYMDRLQATCKN